MKNKKAMTVVSNNLPAVPERLGNMKLVKVTEASPTLPAVRREDPATVATLEEAHAEGLLHIRRSDKRYRSKLPKPGHVWYFINYQIGKKVVYAGAYEMPLEFETYLINKGEGWINKFLFSGMSKELSVDNDIDLETILKDQPQYQAYADEIKQINDSYKKKLN